MIGLLLSAAITVTTPGCVGTGPAEFEEGLKVWCEAAIFEKVHVEMVLDDVGMPTDWTMDLHLNADGFLHLSKARDDFFEQTTGLVETYEAIGIKTRINYFFGGEQLWYCYGDREKRKTICNEVVGRMKA